MSKVGEIYFFGSLRDGFKVFPDAGMASNTFSTYYNNAETDWVLVVKRTEEGSMYTYVKYGLLTSIADGRHGSCLGISIEFVDCYFSSFNTILSEIFEPVFSALVAENQLVTTHASGMVAFVPYTLIKVKDYLEKKAQVIKQVIENKHFAQLYPSQEIPLPSGNTMMALHPNSSAAAILEIFKTGGVLKISPKFKIENRSIAERLSEENKFLRERQEEQETTINFLRGQNENLKREKENLEKEAKEESGQLKSKIQSLNETLQQHIKKSNKGKQDYVIPNGDYDANITPPRPLLKDVKLNPRVIGVTFCVILLSVFFVSIRYCSMGATDPRLKRGSIVKPIDKSTQIQPSQPSVQLTEDVIAISMIPDKNGSPKYYLAEKTFLIYHKDITIRDMDQFKEMISSFLLKHDEEIRILFNNDKEALFESISSNNPNSIRKIRAHIQEKQPFVIENTEELQKLFSGIIIY